MNRHAYLGFLIISLGLFSINLIAQESPTAEDINARLAQLTEPEKSLPDSEILLYEEKRRVEEELEKYKTLSRSLDVSTKQSSEALSKLNPATNKFFQDIEALSCSPLDEKKVDEILSNLRVIRRDLFEQFSDFNSESPWDTILSSLRENPTKAQICQTLKGVDTNKKQELQGFIDNGIKQFEKTQEDNKKLQAQVGVLIQALQKRQAALQTKLNSRDSQQAISSSLWLIILAIGALSIGTIITIKFFDRDLQIEWVASGQVIQFVTVMILLSVIMALGLASILKENTLGTLLGGIAGYVLSQGVGRAAAREVSRRLDQRQDGGRASGSSPNTEAPEKSEDTTKT